MAKIRSLLGIVLALSVWAPGCGSSADVQKKRVRELEEELTRLQNSHDQLEERVTSLEVIRPEAQAEPKAIGATRPASGSSAEAAPGAQERALPATLERPPLKVFKLAPPGTPPADEPASEAAAANDEAADEPRPVIRGQGQRIEQGVAAKEPKRPKTGAPGAQKVDR